MVYKWQLKWFNLNTSFFHFLDLVRFCSPIYIYTSNLCTHFLKFIFDNLDYQVVWFLNILYLSFSEAIQTTEEKLHPLILKTQLKMDFGWFDGLYYFGNIMKLQAKNARKENYKRKVKVQVKLQKFISWIWRSVVHIFPHLVQEHKKWSKNRVYSYFVVQNVTIQFPPFPPLLSLLTADSVI